MSTTTPRTALQEANASVMTTELVCRTLDDSVTLASTNPPQPPAQDLSARMAAALRAVTSQDWGGLLDQSADTIAAKPVDFGLQIIVGTCEYLIGELEGLVEMGTTIAGFTAEYFECARDLGRPLTIWDLDEILASDNCVPFHEAAMAMKSTWEVLQQVKSLSAEAMREMVGEMAPIVADLLVTLLEDGLAMLGEQRDEIEAWLRAIAADAEKLGHLLGTVTGTILLELATAGVSRALKAARIVNRLPDVPIPHAGVLADGAYANAALAPHAAARRDADPLDVLGPLIFQVLQKHRKRFSYNLSWAKRRILRKHIPAEALERFGKWRKRLTHAMAAAFRANNGKIMSYTEGKAFVKKFNRRVLTFHYSDAALDDSLDELGLLARKDAILPNVLEANHIIEARMFEARHGLWADAMGKLGWSSTDDMATVMMGADEHRGSVFRMLMRYGLEEAEARALDPPPSITSILLDKVRLRERVIGSIDDATVLIVEHDTPFITVLTKYAELYKQHSPDLWNRSLCAAFNAWRGKLGLSAPVFTLIKP